jgi:hypothetical protein
VGVRRSRLASPVEKCIVHLPPGLKTESRASSSVGWASPPPASDEIQDSGTRWDEGRNEREHLRRDCRESRASSKDWHRSYLRRRRMKSKIAASSVRAAAISVIISGVSVGTSCSEF